MASPFHWFKPMAFHARHDALGSHPLAVLQDAERGRTVRIAHRGATVLSIEVTHAGARVDLADGYRDAAELEARPSSRFAVMMPFANRIAGARYRFDGVVHDLQPGVAEAERAARHGFVRGVDFRLEALTADADGAEAHFATALAPDAHPGYPFAIAFALHYRLDARGLALTSTVRNTGYTPAPCFFGWHPYFRLGGSPMESWELQVPAATVVATDADFIPLPGAAAHRPLGAEPTLDFRTPRPVGALALNHAYADLRADADGRARTRLRDPASGLGLALWQERGVMLAFTADTVSRDVRGSLALEPMESWADAFNRPDCAAAIRLEPGAERHFRCGVEFETA
ncbi:MAG: aldose epimerase [Lysobacterales bacterium 14-68-21]|jgi:aldose 1-epimerase|nr:MAG: aldose epimerase [Xanthomonadales bacterium 15-68-25]OZB67849.1 MAG: aldose epimerase [Xanthomonadales bacterium 14-68-21]